MFPLQEHDGFLTKLLQYAECWCGNIIQNKAATSLTGDAVANGCSSVCSGNLKEICGGANRLSLYTFTDTVDLITNGDFESGNPPWRTTSNPTGKYQVGLLTGAVVGNEYAAIGSVFSWQVRDSFRNEAQPARSLCVTQTVFHRKPGPHTITAYIGRKPLPASIEPLNYEFLVDGTRIATGEVCSPRNPNNPCSYAAANREKLYEKVQLVVNLGSGDLGQRDLSICAVFTSEKSAAEVFLLDNVSVLGPA